MTSTNSMNPVRKLRNSLYAKAKSEPSFRFYSLWDKVCRDDILAEAYRRCRAKRGAAGTDGVSFDDIETRGREAWLGNLQEELRSRQFDAEPLLRVWIPKRNGGQRPLGIPTIRDRVAQMAVLLVIGPIFEADLLPQQYGFRPRLDAKMAVRRAYFHIKEGLREVVDADLSDYFNTIPHGQLMRSLARRVADGQVLRVIRSWLKAPVIERKEHGSHRTAKARRCSRGTPQGGVISPLLANIYFRRFLLGWEKFGFRRRLRAEVVNYADDLVICCPQGAGEEALEALRRQMAAIGLTVNERKTSLARVPEERFDFLGYTLGQMYGRNGKPYFGTVPSRQAVSRLQRSIHDATGSYWNWTEPSDRVTALNRMIRGWCNYFDQGPVLRTYRHIRRYTERRLRRWLMRRRGKRGTGYRQYPDEFLYETLGLFKPPSTRSDLAKAKARSPG